MTTLQVIVLVVGLLVCYYVGRRFPIPEDYHRRARNQHAIMGALIWMTVFCTWYMQDQNHDIEATAADAAVLAEEVALQERIDDYDNCIDDNNIALGEYARRQTALDDKQDELDELLETGPFTAADLGFDPQDLQDPLLRDYVQGVADGSQASFDAEVEQTTIDRDRLQAGLDSYKADHPIIDCGTNPRETQGE